MDILYLWSLFESIVQILDRAPASQPQPSESIVLIYD
jgi:hypothetical protein